MSTSATTRVTELLIAWSDGDEAAFERLLPLVYDELRRLARGYLRAERGGHTLQTTAIVHEAYLRLVDRRQVKWQNRAHFFAVAAQAMRRLLVDHARTKRRVKRGGNDRQQVSLDEAMYLTNEKSGELILLDEALSRLQTIEPRQSRVVELRYFGGLTNEEVAEILKISANTVMRDWSLARAWLYREMKSENN